MATKDVKFILSFDDKGTAVLKKATKEGVKTLGQFQGKAKDAEKALKGLAKGSGDTGKGMGKLKGMLKSTWGQMAMGMGVMTGVTGLFRTVSRSISSVIQTGREFQASWANTTTMMSTTGQTIDDTGQSLNDMKMELLNMNPLLGGAKGLSEGLYQVLSASVPVAQSLDFLGVASKSAVAGVTDIRTSVDALTTVYNAYGKEAYSVTEVSDIMFQTIKRGKLTYETLAGALGTVVPIASQVGVSFEEVAGAMATMTRQGIDVNTATVALRQTLVSVLKPTKDAVETANRLGIEFTSGAIKSKGFALWLKEVSDKAGDDVDAMTALFGNVRALMGVFALAGDKIEDFTQDVEGMIRAKKEGIVTEQAFVKQLQNADAMLKILKTILDKMKIAIWEGIVKPFQEAILNTDNVAESMAELQKKAIAFGTKLGTAIGKVIKFLVDFRGTIVTVLKVLATLFLLNKVNKWADGFIVNILKVSKHFKIFKTTVATEGSSISKLFKVLKLGIGKLGLAMKAFVVSPAGMVITALVALGVAGYMLIKHWDKVKAFFVKIWYTIKAVFVGAVKAISGLFPDWAKKIIYYITLPWTAGLRLIKPVVKAIVAVAKFLGKGIYDKLKYYVDLVKEAFQAMVGFIKGAIDTVKRWVDKLAFWKKFKKDFKEGMDSVKAETNSVTAVLTEESKKWAKSFIESGQAVNVAKQMFGGLIKTFNKMKPSSVSVVDSLDKQTKALALMVETGKISNKEAIRQVLALTEQYRKAGKDVPSSLTDIADAIDTNVEKTKEAGEEWRKFVDQFKQATPSFKDLTTNARGITQAIAEIEAQGGDTKEVMKSFEGGIIKLYEEGKKFEKVFGKDMPAGVEALKKKLDESDTSIKLVRQSLFNVTKVLATAPAEQKKFEAGFMGINKAGEQVWKSFGEVQTSAKALGVTFKSDLRVSLAKLEEGFEDVMTTGDVLETDQARLIQTIIKMYKQLGLEVPDNYKDMMKELVKHTQDGNKDITKEVSKVGQLLGILGERVGGSLGGIITTVGTGIQQAMQAVQSGVGGIGDVLGAISPLLGQLGGQIGEFISGTEDSFAQLGSSIGSTIGGIFGPLGKAIGSIAGGILGGLFGKKEKKTEEERLAEQLQMQIEETIKSMSKFGEISEATAEKIAKGREELSGFASESKYFGDVIRDVGVSQENINDLWARASDIVHHVTDGFLDATAGAKALDDSFQQLLAGAQEFGTEGSKAMTDFITKVRESGLEVASVTDYINDQLGMIPANAMSASQGLEAMAEMLPIDKFKEWKDRQEEIMEQMEGLSKGSAKYKDLQTELDKVNNKLGNITRSTEKQMKNLESQAMSVFNAMIANGASYTEAMNSIGPTLDKLIEAQTEMGIEGGSAINELLRIREIQTEHQNLFNAIDGNLAVLNALGNTGSLTQQAMQDAGQQTNNYYKKLMKAGLDSNQALAQMAPTLQQLRYYADEHGLALDKNTQKLIDEAEASGVLGEKQMETTDIMLGGFGLIIQALGAEIPDAMQKSVDKMMEFGDSAEATAEDMTNLEHSIHGSGVTGAMGELEKVQEKVFGKMTEEANALIGDFGEIQNEFGNMEVKSTDAFSAINVGLNKMGDHLKENLKEAKNLEKAVKGSGIHGAVKSLEVANTATFGKMNKALKETGKVGKKQFTEMKNTYKKAVTEMETKAFTAPEVTTPVQEKVLAVAPVATVLVQERGLTVEPATSIKSVLPPGVAKEEMDKTKEGEAGDAGKTLVTIEPVILPKENENIIQFVVKKIERGDVKVPVSSVRG